LAGPPARAPTPSAILVSFASTQSLSSCIARVAGKPMPASVVLDGLRQMANARRYSEIWREEN
jgi:hypothetical protein